MRRIVEWLLMTTLWTAVGGIEVSAQTHRVYIGNYTRAPEGGIYQATFDTATGKLSEATVAGPAVNPSFLAIHPSKTWLYAVGEISDFQGQKGGGVSAFAIDAATGKLTLLNAQSSMGAGPCHISLDQTGTTAAVANYGGGSVASLGINPDGTLQPAASAIQHVGGSVNPQRQKEPHAHSIYFEPSQRFVLSADLGLDQVLVYKFDAAKHTLAPNDPPFGKLSPGAGPRHLAIHSNGKFVYAINELASTVTVFAWDGSKGSLTEVQTVPTLPADFPGDNSTAEVVLHPSGKFLYGSNRGHDSLAGFRVDAETGKLTAIGHTPIGGKTPRNFVIDPSGQWVLIGCQNSDRITVFSLDQATGALIATGQSVAAPSPVCLRFLPLR